MIKNTLATVLLIGSFSAFAGTTPLSVKSQATYLINNSNYPVWQLTLTSLENDITIQSLTLNRGNCLISMAGRGKNVNKRLGYGQTLSFTTPSNNGFNKCRPLELTVQTSKGDFTFNWQ
ncbi:hypothetical protein P5G64_09860 [Serratia nevei]|uniref:hypothetical protein n=1 Tax=Serratia marcescens TaxID=615 RepID=UPI0023F7AD16|nr:hypothetical protein [Serratia marcescens]MDF8319148.1 hypothetical protein [Serratia nevei]MDF8324754.1 hypothetical protein [Serratia nevei]MDF8337788.1 hypothetical protein [Serratia nevei]MDF8344613.1 hypothetical protein [Serratia nevei]MDF8348818.1 hypothetical protein [Serratia nevei]